MTKSFILYLTALYPLIINFLLLMMLGLPVKYNKFHPMMLLLILIIVTILTSMKMNYMYNSWISFIMFLVMIGGLMIIYMYISSLANNELFALNLAIIKSNWKIKIFMITYILIYLYTPNMYYNLLDSWNNFYMIPYDQINMSIMYQKLNNNSSYFIMWYLYFTMICVMNLCYKNKLPLRQLKH